MVENVTILECCEPGIKKDTISDLSSLAIPFFQKESGIKHCHIYPRLRLE